jgi:uncharacterized membrane protein
MRPDRRCGPRGDDGTILPLAIFYGVLALALVLLATAATSLYLERKRLFTLADGAALAGAESYDLADLRLVDGALRARLTSDDVSAAVTEYLAAAPAAGFDSLVVEGASTVDGQSATVRLSAAWSPPVVSLLVPEGLRIEVTAVARSVFE